MYVCGQTLVLPIGLIFDVWVNKIHKFYWRNIYEEKDEKKMSKSMRKRNIYEEEIYEEKLKII